MIEHGFSDGPVYLVPNLIAEQDNKPSPSESKYVEVYNLFRDWNSRKQFHEDYRDNPDDFEASSWELIEVPIPGLNIRMDGKPLVPCIAR